jgi:hypothetical protein
MGRFPIRDDRYTSLPLDTLYELTLDTPEVEAPIRILSRRLAADDLHQVLWVTRALDGDLGGGSVELKELVPA